MDKDLKEYEDKINSEEHQWIMDDIKKKMAIVKDKERDYDEIDPDREGLERYDVEDLIVENRLLIDKVDALIGKQESDYSPSRRSTYDDEMSDLSQSLIDHLYQ